jgi:plastocyanin
MSRALSVLIGCSAAVLVAGCGSSSTSTTSTGEAEGSTQATSTSASHGANKLGSRPRFGTPSSSEEPRSGNVQVAYRNITINPDTLRVKVGTTVTWTNYDSVEHDVTSESGPQKFASATFGEGHTFSVKLTKPGVIHYECTIHPASMNGTIEVVK